MFVCACMFVCLCVCVCVCFVIVFIIVFFLFHWLLRFSFLLMIVIIGILIWFGCSVLGLFVHRYRCILFVLFSQIFYYRNCSRYSPYSRSFIISSELKPLFISFFFLVNATVYKYKRARCFRWNDWKRHLRASRKRLQEDQKKLTFFSVPRSVTHSFMFRVVT